MKTIFTFGSDHLQDFKVTPMSIMLVIPTDMRKAREIVFNYDGIGEHFCTSYPYKPYAEEFNKNYHMYELTLEELEKLRK